MNLFASRSDICWKLPRPNTEHPPHELEDLLQIEAVEVVKALEIRAPWVLPRGASGDQNFLPPQAAPLRAVPPQPVATFDKRHEYPWKGIQSQSAQHVIYKLLAPQQNVGSHSSIMRAALQDFVKSAFTFLTKEPNVPENDRHFLTSEAELALGYLVRERVIDIGKDFFDILEAFEVTKGQKANQQEWCSRCLRFLISSAVEASPPEQALAWTQSASARIGVDQDLYVHVDVRAWSEILSLLGCDSKRLDVEMFKSQIGCQLCMDPRNREVNFMQAAGVIAKMKLADAYSAEEILETFNDRALDDRIRQKLLTTVLQNAPRPFIQKVLSIIDENDVETDGPDTEMRMLYGLIRDLNENIRCCRHAFFKMKCDWISSFKRSGPSGVIHSDLLTPEQLSDHIEDDDNYEELLKLAVNKLTKTNDGKFVAARMLARPNALHTKSYENNINDKQMAYLVSLYKEIEPPPPNEIRPIEEDSILLPSREGCCIVGTYDHCYWLQEVLLTPQQPQAIGICWFWRCFDSEKDTHTPASYLALTWGSLEGHSYVVIDFRQLEDDKNVVEAKRIIARILSVPFLLKIVHDLCFASWNILQRALYVSTSPEAPGEQKALLERLEPFIDVGVVVALCKRTSPTAALHEIISDYLRLDCCMSEQLSNFDRRHLRHTQVHYALTQAWCPLVVLRTLCSYGIVNLEQVMGVTMQMDKTGWKQSYRTACFGSEADVAEPDAPRCRNLWTDESEVANRWRTELSRPEPNFNPAPFLESFLLTKEVQMDAQHAVACLFQKQVADFTLDSLYEAYRSAKSKSQ